MSLLRYFTEEQLHQIENTVKKSEKEISGEIVPVFVESSNFYEVAYYRAALLAIFFAFSMLVILDRFVPSIAIFDPLWYFVIVLMAGLSAVTAVWWLPTLRRWMVGEQELQRSTVERAKHFFIREEVFNSKARTGIMIFVSFFEHRVIVMADEGINRVVDPGTWDEVVQIIVRSIKKDETTYGIIKGILKCADILKFNEFLVCPDDTNELSDRLRTD